jgi:NAD(P)-dependent dehydrogenase (short-subunit alcohol dehydrogenase family)
MRSVVITGAGSGLGRALAQRLAADGETVVVLGRTPAKIEAAAEELGGCCYAVRCDVGSADSVGEAFATIAEKTPVIDVLINNAATYQPFLVKDATDAQIGEAVMTDLAGPIYCARAAIPMLKKGSHIINVSSETVTIAHAMLSLYQSSKAGLERFSDALRNELEPDGIRVTMVRAGQMMGADSRAPSNDMNVLRRFAEENLKRGLDLRARPISTFSSAAEVIRGLIHLPADINVPQIVLEARRP